PEVDRDPPTLFLLPPVGIAAGQRTDERRLAVVDVTRRAEDELTHEDARRYPSGRSANGAARPRSRGAPGTWRTATSARPCARAAGPRRATGGPAPRGRGPGASGTRRRAGSPGSERRRPHSRSARLRPAPAPGRTPGSFPAPARTRASRP